MLHPHHSPCQFPIQLNGTPWSKNVLRVALMCPSLFSRCNRSRTLDVDAVQPLPVNFQSAVCGSERTRSLRLVSTWHWVRLGISRNQTKPAEVFYGIQTMFKINGLRPRGQHRRLVQLIVIVKCFNILPSSHHASEFITTMASRYLTESQGPHD